MVGGRCQPWPRAALALALSLARSPDNFSPASQCYRDLPYNPQLLAGGFGIYFFSLYLLMAFQIVQRCFWHSWLASRSSMKMTEISPLFLLLLDNQISGRQHLSLPMRDPRDAGQGLSKDFCGSRAGGKVPTQLAAATQAEGAAPSVYVYGRTRRHFQRERKARSKYI